MRAIPLLALCIFAVSASGAESPSTSQSQLPKDPRGILAAARSLYDYSDPSLKPWHLSGTYQIYDDAGKPSLLGKYELWWAAPNVYRSNWSRVGASRTEWHTADGRSLQQSSGDRLFYFEHAIGSLILSSVPDPSDLDQTGDDVKRDQIEVGKYKLPCVEISGHKRSDGKTPSIPGVLAGSYCFDPSPPVLRIERLFNRSIFVGFDKLMSAQGRVLPFEITITNGVHNLLAFNVDTSGTLTDADVVKPPADAQPFLSPDRPVPGDQGALAKKVFPVYPMSAKSERISGTVVLDTMIEKDGKVTDMRVLSSPSPVLTSASEDAVAHWQYLPRLLDGQPQEFNAIINVIFTLGN